jgi:hypothetical protein
MLWFFDDAFLMFVDGIWLWMRGCYGVIWMGWFEGALMEFMATGFDRVDERFWWNPNLVLG